MHSIGANAADATSRRALNWSPKVCRQLQAVLGHRVSQNWYSIIRRAMHPPNLICIDSRRGHAMRGLRIIVRHWRCIPARTDGPYVARPKRETSNRTEFLRRWRAALQGFRREASPVPHRWVVNFIQTPVGRWAHTCFDRAVVASRPGLISAISLQLSESLHPNISEVRRSTANTPSWMCCSRISRKAARCSIWVNWSRRGKLQVSQC